MNYTDSHLEAMSADYSSGLTDTQLEGAIGTPGPMAWLLDVVDDWDAFTARAAAENLSAEDLVRKAVDAYLNAA